ncbi:MAG: transposase [Rubrobacter sp.]|nr:transposase [Rubrobacter sp.]
MRKAEVRLAEPAELRDALGLRKTPDHTTLYHFLQRLDERALVATVNETARRLLKPNHDMSKRSRRPWRWMQQGWSRPRQKTVAASRRFGAEMAEVARRG